MNIRAMLVAAVMMVAPYSHAVADNIAEPRTVLLPDIQAHSCGTWTVYRRTQPALAGMWRAWVIGFVSGVNLKSDYPDALVGRDIEGMTAWLDNYCQANPLADIVTASLQLLEQLRAPPAH